MHTMKNYCQYLPVGTSVFLRCICVCRRIHVHVCIAIYDGSTADDTLIICIMYGIYYHVSDVKLVNTDSLESHCFKISF